MNWNTLLNDILNKIKESIDSEEEKEFKEEEE